MNFPKRYFLEIAYKGTHYHGWQVQPNQVSVQSTIEHALSTIINEPIAIVGCGRTDTGVHASQYFAHFETTKALPQPFVRRVNSFLPTDIAIKKIITEIPATAHARFDATFRAYDYCIHFKKNPFLTDQSWHYTYPAPDFKKMQQAAHLLLNYTDFAMFCKTGGDNKTTLCQIFESELFVDEAAGKVRYRVAANRFLRGMVRRIVGALMSVGKNKISLEEFIQVMDTQGRFKYNDAAPPQGLFLSEVRYDFLKK